MPSLVRTLGNACGLALLSLSLLPSLQSVEARAINARAENGTSRERLSINADWKFSRFEENPDGLYYDDMKDWILPCGNDFIVDGDQHETPSEPGPGGDVEYVQASFDDGEWESVNLPHDWAIKGPFNAPGVSGGMGRLPSNGVGWYRRTVTTSAEDEGKTVYLDVDGAMSYAAVWLNGNLVGGWPYGYNSFRLDLTPYLETGDNTLAIRVDNALDNSRWYPGAGIYRNVWLVKVNPAHVAQYGTYITTPEVSDESATVDLTVEVENTGEDEQQVDVVTDVYAIDSETGQPDAEALATFESQSLTVAAGEKQTANGSVTISSPQLWGPLPSQTPNLHVAVTTLSVDGTTVDSYETRFGIRSVVHDPNEGILVNGQAVRTYGTNNHADHGSLGSAFNIRAAERQLQILQELGSNALRTSHNPPAPELLDLADSYGFMVMDEINDCWDTAKTTNDFHLIFPDWHEPDLRSFMRRDRNHPSVLTWSVGNELPEQDYPEGGTTGQMLVDIAHSEDTNRPVTVGLNAPETQPIAAAMDVESLNYQGEGWGTSTQGAFPWFHDAFPDKLIWSSESSSAVSTRGTYIFPVTADKSATVDDGSGGDSYNQYVSAYELYATSWGSSPDKVFEAHDRNPYVAGEFVWSGFDYLGEPTPYDTSRSSYFGIIDLAGFKKDRFYIYQARWRPDFPMAHVLPHWSWPDDRVGENTPVHVFTSGDEAELFVNGVSAGRQQREEYTYRFRWDDVTYEPGNITVVAYKNGEQWAEDTKITVGEASKLNVTADRTTIDGDGYDLSYITVAVVDENDNIVPDAANGLSFSVEGHGEIVATDNGDPTDMTAFPSLDRNAFNGLALAIVRSNPGETGEITVSVSSDGLEGAEVAVQAS
ncbi:hypothetical protein FQN54_006344 [Arachnomyces sp. PD_36]|nr:hypothetical protein FQN54_006344 [Arachnomyces sp. PD_36]